MDLKVLYGKGLIPGENLLHQVEFSFFFKYKYPPIHILSISPESSK
jgi:hypothetical protein